LGKARAVGDRFAEKGRKAQMIIRRRHTANFTVIANELFDDERLKADELGILGYLRSRPDNWEIRRPALMRRFGMGREAIRRVVLNLIRTGWVHALRLRRRDGTLIVVYVVKDEAGPELSEQEVRRALSLVSSEAVADNPAEDQSDLCLDASLRH
jgi:hypothetical protein